MENPAPQVSTRHSANEWQGSCGDEEGVCKLVAVVGSRARSLHGHTQNFRAGGDSHADALPRSNATSSGKWCSRSVHHRVQDGGDRFSDPATAHDPASNYRGLDLPTFGATSDF